MAKMNSVLLQLNRLKRHYETCINEPDEVALVDLSHSLRMLADLKNVLPELVPAFKTTLCFKSAMPAKKVWRAARGSRFVFAYMPDGVFTRACDDRLAEAPPPENDGGTTFGCSVMRGSDGSMELRNYCFIATLIDKTLIKAMSAADVSRCNYKQWLGAEAVRTAYVDNGGGLITEILSREVMIRRVANAMDGSHPSAAALPEETGNRYDPAVQQLADYRMGGLPLAYFVLLKIAQDILSIAPKLLDVGLEDDVS